MTELADLKRVAVGAPDDLDWAEAKLRDATEELEVLRFRSARLLDACLMAANVFLEMRSSFGLTGHKLEATRTAEALLRDAMVDL